MSTYVAGVVTTHVIFALLEKKRLENWADKGEVNQLPSSLKIASGCARPVPLRLQH